MPIPRAVILPSQNVNPAMKHTFAISMRSDCLVAPRGQLIDRARGFRHIGHADTESRDIAQPKRQPRNEAYFRDIDEIGLPGGPTRPADRPRARLPAYRPCRYREP